MRLLGILDRYLLREWWKIFLVTVLGFPLMVIVIDLTDRLDEYLAQGLEPKAIALSYVFSLVENMSMVLPAAVLFATVFTVSIMGRHSEITVAKASGCSFHRLILPVLGAAAAAALLALLLVEIAPPASRRQAELLGEKERRSQTTRYNFVYRAEKGWVYVIRSLDLNSKSMRNLQLEREGTGPEYPTLVVQSRRGLYTDSLRHWTLTRGRLRILTGSSSELAFAFDSLRHRELAETPTDLLAEPKEPREMRYAELSRYIEALERSGGDGRPLRVKQALKLAVPVTCIIIAIFGAPLAVTSPRAGTAFGLAVSLATTMVFLTLIRLSEAVGASGVLPPTWAAWAPNVVFGAVGLWLMKQVRT